MVGDDRCAATWPAYFSNLDRVCAESDRARAGELPAATAAAAWWSRWRSATRLGFRLAGLTNFGPVPCASAPTMFTRVAADPIRNALAAGLDPGAIGSGARPLRAARRRRSPSTRSGGRTAARRASSSRPASPLCSSASSTATTRSSAGRSSRSGSAEAATGCGCGRSTRSARRTRARPLPLEGAPAPPPPSSPPPALERAAQVLVLGDPAGGVEAQADDVEAQLAVAGDVVAAVAQPGGGEPAQLGLLARADRDRRALGAGDASRRAAP